MNPKQEVTTVQKKKIRKRRRRMAWWRWAFLIVAAFVTVTSAVCIGVFIGILRELPSPETLENYDPQQISHVFDRTGAVPIGEFRGEDEHGNTVRRQIVKYEEIPPMLRDAVISIEDSRFFEHFGVDKIGIARAIRANVQGGGVRQGASTITMQLARQPGIIPVVGREKSLWRKIKEVVFALEIERRYSKQQILGFYLNHIEFGSTAFGVSAAANTFFSKPLDQLTLAECATLAAMINGPGKYSPVEHPDNAVRRRNIVLKSMRDLGKITEEQYEAACSEPLKVNLNLQAIGKYPYFFSAVASELKFNNPWPNLTAADLEQKGLRITTTLDPSIQEICEHELRDKLVDVERMWVEKKAARHYEEIKEWNGKLKPGDVKLMRITRITTPTVSVELNQYHGTFKLPDNLPYYNAALSLRRDHWIDVLVEDVDEASGRIQCKLGDTIPVQGSIVVLDARNGEVLALVGGANFANNRWNGKWNRAIQGGRQAGSCFKPFVYAAALERGFTPADMIVDEPVEYDSGSPHVPPYRPVNYEHDFEGPMTLVKALEHSRNVVAIRLFEAVGPQRAIDVMRRFDYTDQRGRWPLRREMSLPLGTINATPYQMAAAYQVFANLGVGIRPQLVTSIQNNKGETLPRPKREETTVVDPVAAYQVQYMMRQVVISGTGATQIGSKFKSPPAPPICGKTGTTNDSVDAWFVGFTPDLVIAVQVGFDSPRPMGPGMNGGPVAGPIWASVLKKILKTRPDNAWRTTFQTPPGIMLANVCAATGKRAGPSCGDAEHHVYYNCPFRAGQEPSDVCDGSYAARTPIIQPVSSEYAGYNCRIHGTAHGLTN